ncbi:probable disease resistance protein At4g27220 [Capsicum annuum]|uniref:probable disease resistance protein At4g27220 n=1 Tax=Capsicum annuum TaxID=4072 RepID=UPI001FB07BB7|nr:probable disease resistance protein At4g27220 [Capsicum annuum]
MHDVVRDVARWIASTFGDEHTSVFQAGIGLTETMSLLLQGNEPLEKIPRELFLAFPALRVLNLSETSIREVPSSINSLCQLRALILQSCFKLTELPPVANLHNLQVFDCDNSRLRCLPQGMENLTNLRLLNMLAPDLKSISKGFSLKFPSIEMLNMSRSCLGATSFDEISSLHNLTYLSIRVDSSSCFNRDYSWMTRVKGFLIEVGETLTYGPYNKSIRAIKVHKCEIFSNGELSGMLQFASDLHLEYCGGLRKLIGCNRSNGLKLLKLRSCSCSFGPVEGGSGKFDPLPNLEHLDLHLADNLKSVSDFGQYLGLTFSKLRQLNISHCATGRVISHCASLTCLFNDGGICSVPKHLEEIMINNCFQLVELYVQCSSSDQATLVNSEIPRVRKLYLYNAPQLGTLGEPQSMLVPNGH